MRLTREASRHAGRGSSWNVSRREANKTQFDEITERAVHGTVFFFDSKDNHATSALSAHDVGGSPQSDRPRRGRFV